MQYKYWDQNTRIIRDIFAINSKPTGTSLYSTCAKKYAKNAVLNHQNTASLTMRRQCRIVREFRMAINQSEPYGVSPRALWFNLQSHIMWMSFTLPCKFFTLSRTETVDTKPWTWILWHTHVLASSTVQ